MRSETRAFHKVVASAFLYDVGETKQAQKTCQRFRSGWTVCDSSICHRRRLAGHPAVTLKVRMAPQHAQVVPGVPEVVDFMVAMQQRSPGSSRWCSRDPAITGP